MKTTHLLFSQLSFQSNNPSPTPFNPSLMSSYNLIPPLMPLLLSLLCFIIFHYSSTYALHVNFYKQSCPNVEKLVLDVIQSATKLDPTVPTGLLRMHFHDCFIEVTSYTFINCISIISLSRYNTLLYGNA